MQAERVDIVDQAIAWHLRLAEAGEADWAAFVAWLEHDPDHAAAYDRVAAQDRAIAADQFTARDTLADNDNEAGQGAARRRGWWMAGGVAAAAVLAALIVPGMVSSGPIPYMLATADGERRAVTLPDGTVIEMSGGTAIDLDRADPRVATLDRGEAVFHVRHDAARPFTVTSGNVAIRDLGTVFNVARGDRGLTVAVAEGSVLYRPGATGVTLRAGDQLSARDDGGVVVRSRIAPELVGGWRRGTLNFSGERLGEVGATMRRLYGYDVAVQGDLSARPFTGMVHFSGSADRDIPHLAGLIGATWRREGNRWILADAAPPTP